MSLRQSLLATVTLALALGIARPDPVQAQFAKKAAQLAFCAGAAFAGAKLGEKLAQAEARRQHLVASQAAKLTRGLQIGTAAILCKVGISLAGTVYARFSKKDMEARQKEIEAAVAEAEPVSRDYVMPESHQAGKITTQQAYDDGNKECKLVVDNLADVNAGEPAVAKYCRDKNGGQWELQIM